MPKLIPSENLHAAATRCFSFFLEKASVPMDAVAPPADTPPAAAVNFAVADDRELLSVLVPRSFADAPKVTPNAEPIAATAPETPATPSLPESVTPLSEPTAPLSILPAPSPRRKARSAHWTFQLMKDAFITSPLEPVNQVQLLMYFINEPNRAA